MTEVQKQIVLAFANTNMNITETARQMHYHLNTIRYHLDRIKYLTGLDPKNFHDLYKLEQMLLNELEEDHD